MRNNNRVLWIVIGALVLVVCLCVGVIALAVAGITIWNVNVQPDPDGPGFPSEVTVEVIQETPTEQQIPLATPLLESPTPDELDNPTDEPEPTEEVTATPESTQSTSSAELPAEIAAQMEAIEDQVIELRGLQSEGEVERALLTPEQLRERVINEFFEDYTAEEAQQDARVLAAFGLLDPDFDMYEFYIELYSEQVAGYYDDETKSMYVIQDRGFQGPQRLTYAHEYTHALQDLTYDLENGLNYNDEACEEDSERCAAVQALVEGDASLLELQWFVNHGTSQDAAELQEFYENYSSPVFDQAPAFMREDFIFPYSDENGGMAFVQNLYDQGGWEAVDAAYQNLPVSTEQILHPERYPQDSPVPVELPDLAAILGDGWEQIDSGVMGEWYTYLILAFGRDPQARLDVEQARDATVNWGGDAYAVYYNEETDQTAMVMQSLWESESQAQQFAASFQDYATARFGNPTEDEAARSAWDTSEGYTQFQVDGATTTWILAPDAETASAVLSNVQSN